MFIALFCICKDKRCSNHFWGFLCCSWLKFWTSLTFLHIYIHTCIHTYNHTCMHAYILLDLNMKCVCVRARACVRVHVYVNHLSEIVTWSLLRRLEALTIGLQVWLCYQKYQHLCFLLSLSHAVNVWMFTGFAILCFSCGFCKSFLKINYFNLFMCFCREKETWAFDVQFTIQRAWKNLFDFSLKFIFNSF